MASSPRTPRDDASRVQLESAFLGTSPLARAIRASIVRAGRTDATVLICGESGVGKELVARQIHALSRRARGPFVAINCAAIPDDLLESELFGHEAGAFTDSRGTRRGAFELADRGTLFLDEVGDLSPRAQPKLLRALETAEVVRVGAERGRRVDLRIVSATNHDLRRMCFERRFREDLFFRLCILEIRVPPLRDRPEDVALLAQHFAREIGVRSRRGGLAISDAALDALRRQPWPGNVRELRAALERAVAMASGSVVDLASLDLDNDSAAAPRLRALLRRGWRDARRGFERAYLARLLERHAGNVRRAARAAGLSRTALYKMLRRTGLRRE